MKNSILLFYSLLFTALLSAQANNTRLFSLSLPAYDYIDSPVMIGFSIRDNMGDTIHSISISYTVNGGMPVRATISTWLSGANSGPPVSLVHPVPLLIHTAGDYIITGTVDSLDHIACATPYSDSTTTYSHFYAASPLLHKRVVFEEFTGAWCGHCSGGAYDMQTIVSSDTDFILVAAHIASSQLNDSMQTAEAIAMHDIWAGYPGVTINRTVFEADGRTYAPNALYMVPLLEGLANKSKHAPSPVNVSMTGLTYDTLTRLMSVDVNATFLATISHGDFRVNLTFIEDSIIHPGITLTEQGWNQNNYNFSHLSSGIDDTIPALFNLTQTLLNDGQPGGWAHNHVLRKMMGGAWGDTAIIPVRPTAGSTYTKHYSYTMPTKWNEKQLSLIAMVQEFHPINANHQPAEWSNPDLILNAVKQPLLPKKQVGASGIISLQDEGVHIYPNPCNGTFNIQTGNTASNTLQLYDVSGYKVFERVLQEGGNSIHLDLPSGIYQVILITSGLSQHQKLVIIR